MKKIIAFFLGLVSASTGIAQWGAKAGLELNLRSNGGWNSSPRLILGVDHDHGRRWSSGADALLWSGRVNDVIVHDAHGAFAARYDRTTTDLTAQVRLSYLLSGNQRASFHLGPVLGVTYRNERLTLDGPVPNGSAFPSTHEVAYATVPVGLRVGVRDELPGGYLEISSRFMYEVGGSGRLFEIGAEQFEAIADHRVRKPEWTIGLSAAYGFCFSGCNDPGALEARRADRARRALGREDRRLADFETRPWGVRLILLESAFDNSRRGGPSTGFVLGGMFRPSTFNGVGFDMDMNKRWSLGVEALMDPVLAFGGKQYGGVHHDPSAAVMFNGNVQTQGARIHYEQSGGAYAVNARAAYRFSDRRRSSPYAGGWTGLRIDRIVMSDPSILIDGRPAGEGYTLSTGPLTGMSATHITIPVGLRLGLDLRAGATYYDLYLYGGYKIGADRDYFDVEMRGTELEGGDVQLGGVMRDHPFSFGFGAAMGIGRRTRTTSALGGN